MTTTNWKPETLQYVKRNAVRLSKVQIVTRNQLIQITPVTMNQSATKKAKAKKRKTS